MDIKAPYMDWSNPDRTGTYKLFKQKAKLFFEVKDIAVGKQVSYILLMTGDEGVHMYNSWELSDEEAQDPSVVWSRFDAHVEPTSNFRVERLTFQRMKQRMDESSDDFLSRLTNQANKCKFRDKEERLIEQLTFGTKHADVQKTLLVQDTDYTLAKAIEACRIYDASVSHQQAFQNIQVQSGHTEVHAVRQGYRSDNSCQQCGLLKHRTGEKCPAKGTACRRCGGKDHWAQGRACPAQHQVGRGRSRGRGNTPHRGRSRGRGRGRGGQASRGRSQSRSRGIYVVEAESPEAEEEFTTVNYDVITINSVQSADVAHATVHVKLPHRCISDTLKLKLDTGAEGNILPLRIFRKMFPEKMDANGYPRKDAVRVDTGVRLTAYNGGNIPQYGVTSLACQYRQSAWHNVSFYIADTDGPAILGLSSCRSMKLVDIRCDENIHEVKTSGGKETSLDSLKQNYPGQFDTIGNFKQPLHLYVDPEVSPVVHPNRKYAIQRKEAIRQELDRMVAMGVIVPETRPTDWVSSITLVEKANGSLRVCLDPKDLNRALKRPIHKTPTLEEITHQFSKAKFFSKLDAKNGYWSIHLDEESSLMTTFNTPFGRYRFLRLPFGLVVSQDVFQQRMDVILERCPGCTGIADDVAVHGATEQEHDSNLWNLMEVAKQEGLVFNSSKCLIKVKEIPFFGQVYSADGVKPDPERVKAIRQLPEPESKQEVREFLGIATYMSPYVPRLSHHAAPLRDLLKQDVEFEWTEQQQSAFKAVKDIICEETMLAYFDPEKDSVIQVDSSLRGIGAVLLQEGKPIAFASKALTETEARYANIERELLAAVYGAERFHTYVYGKPFVVHSDHKPLAMIQLKNLHSAPPRLQRMLLRLQKYNMQIEYRPGKTMLLADGLSRLPGATEKAEIKLDLCVNLVQFSSEKVLELREETSRDAELGPLRDLIIVGWPEHQKDVPKLLRPYWSYRDELAVEDGVIVKGSQQVMIPRSMQPAILEAIHAGHQGRDKCRMRAKSSVFWNGITNDIEQLVAACSICQKYARSQTKEPLLPKDVPPRPWHTLASDFFQMNGVEYMLVVDAFSKFPFVKRMGKSADSAGSIRYLKELFSIFGVPEVLYTDNGSQFTSHAFSKFAQVWMFRHTTSSPVYPQSNGLIERTVGTVKTALIKAAEDGLDPDLALLCLRTTPVTDTIASPVELLMKRKAKSNLPVTLKASQADVQAREELVKRQEKQRVDYDRTAGPELPALCVGQQVRVQDQDSGLWIPAKVLERCPEPRSYIVETPNGGQLRRNRRHLAECPPGRPPEPRRVVRFSEGDASSEAPAEPVPDLKPRPGFSRYGRQLKKTERLDL
jgi:hypothetical protein